jgi:hypothetical protein
VTAQVAAEAAKPAPTPEQIAASNAVVKPMILDGLMTAFLADTKIQPVLKGQLVQAQSKPAKLPEYLDDAVDDAVAFLQAADIHDYDWKPVIADMKSAKWDYIGFDVADSTYLNKSTAAPVNEDEGAGNEATPAPKSAPPKDSVKAPPFVVKYPTELNQWFMPDFDTKKAGWKNGAAPFGMKMDEMVPESLAWIAKYPLYPLKRTMPTTTIGNDVVLMRQTFDLPPAKEGHRYRIRLDGSIHENSGEGYAIYINGKPLTEVTAGVTAWRRQGLRGSQVWQDFLGDFKGGKVTIAVANFPMNNYNPDYYIPAIGPLSVSIEEQKLPSLGQTP